MSTTPSTLDDFAIDPVTLAWVKARQAANIPPISELPLDMARAGLEAAQAQYPDKPKALSDDVPIPAGPGGRVMVRLLRPSGAQGRLPVVVAMHGGGWVLGSIDSHDRLARDIMQASGAAVAMVQYSLAPEARYPVALEECYGVAAWLAEHGGALGLDGSRLALAGDSSGANLAAAAAILAKRRGGPAVRCQALIYPVTDASCDSPSYRRFADGPNLTRQAMRWYWDQYAPDQDAKAQDTASVLGASLETLAGLPPALVVTAELDVLRDDGEAYARRLVQAGVEVHALRMVGALHGFAAHNALARTPATLSALAVAGAFLRQRLA